MHSGIREDGDDRQDLVGGRAWHRSGPVLPPGLMKKDEAVRTLRREEDPLYEPRALGPRRIGDVEP